MEFRGQKIKFIETTQVKEGVVCDVYEFENDTSKDLGIVKVSKGFKTPMQKVIEGDKTIEIFREGAGQLTVIGADKKERVYSFPGQQSEVKVAVGEIMQWEATEDLTFAEVCCPPYKDGRFQNFDDYIQKFIDDFRFQIVDENNIQRSSTWTIRQNNNEDSIFVYPKTFGQKMGLSFHPRSTSDDGNDSQWGIKYKDYRQDLEEKGYLVPKPHRWKRPYDDRKIKRVSSILFPTDYMTGEVYQFVNEKKPKVSLPLAPIGHAIEVSIFSHQLSPETVESELQRYKYTPFFFMTLSSGEIATVAFRQTQFDRANLPKEGTYHGNKLSNQRIDTDKFLHAIFHNSPKDGEGICLIETNGFKINN